MPTYPVTENTGYLNKNEAQEDGSKYNVIKIVEVFEEEMHISFKELQQITSKQLDTLKEESINIKKYSKNKNIMINILINKNINM